MYLSRIPAQKLLKYELCGPKLRESLVRELIRNEKLKIEEPRRAGGHFHTPLWADAKRHFRGEQHLISAAENRILQNEKRRRLYTVLAVQLVEWWDRFGRTTNLPLRPQLEQASGNWDVPELNLAVGVHGCALINRGDTTVALYPYFCETPSLDPNAASMGLAMMKNALKLPAPYEFRILDVMRGVDFELDMAHLEASERRTRDVARALLTQFNALKVDYE